MEFDGIKITRNAAKNGNKKLGASSTRKLWKRLDCVNLINGLKQKEVFGCRIHQILILSNLDAHLEFRDSRSNTRSLEIQINYIYHFQGQNRQFSTPSLISRQTINRIFVNGRFCGLVGYGVCFTRRKSPVRSWAESSVRFFFLSRDTRCGVWLVCSTSITRISQLYLTFQFGAHFFFSLLNFSFLHPNWN